MKLQTCLSRASNLFLGSVTRHSIVNAAKTMAITTVFSIGGTVFFAAGTARAAFVQFTFSDLSPFDSGGSGVEIKDGLTLSTVKAEAPQYSLSSGNYTWTGIYIPATTNISGNNRLGIDNPTIGGSTPLSNENQSFHNGESWTFKLDLPVKLTEIAFVAWDSTGLLTDQVTFTVQGETPVVINGGTSPKTNPLAPLEMDFVIPANTNITIANTNPIPDYIESALTVTNTPWRINTLTFEIVPEPSGFLSLGIAFSSFCACYRWKRKT